MFNFWSSSSINLNCSCIHTLNFTPLPLKNVTYCFLVAHSSLCPLLLCIYILFTQPKMKLYFMYFLFHWNKSLDNLTINKMCTWIDAWFYCHFFLFLVGMSQALIFFYKNVKNESTRLTIVNLLGISHFCKPQISFF